MKTGSTGDVKAGHAKGCFKGGSGKSMETSSTPIKTVKSGHATFGKKEGHRVGAGTRTFSKKTP
jgi:hypothetical protein